YRLQCPRHTNTFDLVSRITYARRICKTQRYTIHIDRFGKHIARRTGYVCDNCPVGADQAIKHARLADVRFSEDREPEPRGKDFPVIEGIPQAIELGSEWTDTVHNRGIARHSDVVFRKVYSRFEPRNRTDQFVFDGTNVLRDRALHLPERHPGLLFGLRFNEFLHRLRLNQIHFSMCDSAQRKLSWRSWPGTSNPRSRHDSAQR